MSAKPAIYYFSSTHWDREWYDSFQRFRFRLVEMINEVIDVLEEKPQFQTFHLDGQTIVLDDFLEIEPAKRERLRRLIENGRIVVGPWYVMPDEFLLSGESLIRNLLKGGRISRDWGTEPWKYGYLCDIFGHIAQMPQIFNGFDIPYAVLTRGLNDESVPAHFRWQAPDGSECMTFKLQDRNTYGSLLVVIVEAENKRLSPEETKLLLKTSIDKEMARSPIPVCLLMDCQDHARIRPNTDNYLRMIAELYPEAEVKHVNLEQMGKQLEPYKEQMPVRIGELNETGHYPGNNYLITHTLSSRYPLKKANDECQTLLEKWVEPLAAISTLRGFPVRKAYIDLAYTYLLQNHPHDSICGCSIDQVHRDMMYRFDQAREIASHLSEQLIDRLTDRSDVPDSDGTIVLSLWNPLPYARRCVTTVNIDFDPDYPAKYQEPFGYEWKNSFLIYDCEGNEIPYGLLAIKRNYPVKVRGRETKWLDRHTISLEVDVPAMGCSEYVIVPSAKPSRYLTGLSRRQHVAENEFIRLTVNGDGTIRLEDKRNGKQYDQLISYLDDGEIGDGWYHANPVEDRLISSRGTACIIETIENTPVRTVFQLTHVLRVPAYMDYHPYGIRRSSEMAAVTIRSRIGLSKGAASIDVETEIDNIAKDHRLRLVIPTNVASQTYFANQPFAFVERRVGIRMETENWKECDPPEKQMGGIVGRRANDGSGLAFVSAFGLHECAVADDPDGSIHITLFRAFGKTYLTPGEEGGQMNGVHTFKFAIAALDDATSFADLTRLQECLQTGMHVVSAKAPKNYILAHPVSHVELSRSDICLNMLKCPEDGAEGELIARFCNMSDRPATARFTCFKPLHKVMLTNLAEQPAGTIGHDGHSFDIQLAAWKIQTYRLSFA